MNATGHKMHYPAPRRAWTGSEASHPWTLSEVIEYRKIGGWFAQDTQFADNEARKAAGVRISRSQVQSIVDELEGEE